MDVGDQIAALLKSALEAKNFAADFGYTAPYEIETQSRCRFELIAATDTTQIKISAFEEPTSQNFTRQTVIQDHRLGIALVKHMRPNDDGSANETEFRQLKQLAGKIKEWAWTALAGFPEYSPTKCEIPAKFDSEKADSHDFLTVVTVIYRTSYDK